MSASVVNSVATFSVFARLPFHKFVVCFCEILLTDAQHYFLGCLVLKWF